MHWFKPNFKSIYGILGRPDQMATPAAVERIEDVRRRMLDIMTAEGLDVQRRDLFSKIRYAGSIHALWYARSDVMAALAGQLGEQSARQRMTDVSLRFTGLLPEARTLQRPRRLI